MTEDCPVGGDTTATRPVNSEAGPASSLLGRRVLVGASVGTVRYVGPVEGAKRRTKAEGGREQGRVGKETKKEEEEEWFGIEWDDPSRGKNDGSVNGRRYFDCTRHASCSAESSEEEKRAEIKPGSFVRKAAGKINFGRSFVSALKERYGGEDMEEEEQEERLNEGVTNLEREEEEEEKREEMFILSGGKTVVNVEFVGKEKIQNVLSQLVDLKEVGLSNAQISHAEVLLTGNQGAQGVKTRKRNLIQRLSPNIEGLDLSANMLRWQDVFEICSQLKHLQSLNLSSNSFENVSISGGGKGAHGVGDNEEPFAHVKVLFLNSVYVVNMKAVGDMLKWFVSSLRELHYCLNGGLFRFDADMLPPTIAGNLQLLNLEGNSLKWEDCCKLASMGNLKTLILNRNCIEKIEYESSGAEAGVPFSCLENLSLIDNEISSWQNINALDKFPRLKSLSLKRNPICKGDMNTTNKDFPPLTPSDFRIEVISRVASLERMNNSNVHPRERVDAERDYVRIYRQDWETAFIPSDFQTVVEAEKGIAETALRTRLQIENSEGKEGMPETKGKASQSYLDFVRVHPRYHFLMTKHDPDFDYSDVLYKRKELRKLIGAGNGTVSPSDDLGAEAKMQEMMATRGAKVLSSSTTSSKFVECKLQFATSIRPLIVNESLVLQKKLPKTTTIAKMKNLVHKLFAKMYNNALDDATTSSSLSADELDSFTIESLRFFIIDVQKYHIIPLDDDNKQLSFYTNENLATAIGNSSALTSDRNSMVISFCYAK
eukprot:Nk52_evm38s2402 gene=Nk52_evmTU38s2402